MSTSSEFAGRAPARLPSFSQTCSLLSQYLKENKAAITDLNLAVKPEMFRKPVAPLNFFPIPENPSSESTLKNTPAQSLKPMDSFAQVADSSVKVSDAGNEPKTASAQMTIFYAGQVIVFDEFPADKAKEVMLLASQGNNSQVFTPQPAFAAPKIPIETNARVPPSTLMGDKPIQDNRQNTPAEPRASDLPIARRKSLHRFLEKRKDRITSKSPYQIADTSASASAADKKSWLSLAASD